MKRAGLHIIFICIVALFFTSCENDSVDYGLGEYYVEITTYQGDKTFLLDNNLLLLGMEGDINSSFKSGQRIWLNYSILPEKSPGFDHTIRINGASSVIQAELQGVAPITIDTLANAPIQFESSWIGSHYLNLMFSIEYQSEPHKIALVTDSGLSHNDSIHIYLRHDTNNDPPGYKSKAIVSCNLQKLLDAPEGNRKIFLHLNTSNYGNKVYELTY